MNGFTPLLIFALLLATATSGLTETWFCDLSSGKMNVSFGCGHDGLRVTYDGVQIIRDSTIWVHNPSWTYHYYGLPHLKDAIKISEIDGGKEAVITHRSASFLATERITVKPDQVSVEMKYKLLEDVSDADMEYCFGNICAALILGRPFKAVTAAGETKEGTVPIRATDPGIEKSLLINGQIQKIEFDSRIGKMIFEVTGEPAGISIFDRRMSPYESADSTPVFWAGILGIHLEYGKEYTQTITLSIKPSTRPDLPVVLPAAETKAIPKDDLRSPSSGPVYVIPEPQEMKLSDEDFILDESTKIVVADSAYSEDWRGARSFAEEIKLLYGFEPKIIRESEADTKEPLILVGEIDRNKLLAEAALNEGISAPQKEEGYALKVTRRRVLVAGHDRKGSFYGMQTLKQLVKASPQYIAVQGCTINDWPSLKFRGVHLFTGNQALPFHKKLIDRVLSRFKMNHLVLEVDFIKWKTDPELAVPFSMDQDDLKMDIEYARKHFMEVTPLLQSLGHCDWLFTNGKNRDMAENPDKPYSYCPSHPKIYDYIFSFYDETVKLFDNPEFVHIGHDEVVEPGGFPKHELCKKRTSEEIFVGDVLRIHEHLTKHGARVMMWGDMMLYKGDAPDAMNARSAEDAKWIRNRLPKNILITDWHYAPGKPEEFKSIDIFTKEGYDTVAATWFTPANIEAFSKQAKNVGALGLLQTTWAGFNSNENNLKNSFNQFSAMVLAAEYGWNSGKTDLDHLPYKWDEEFRKQWDPKPVDRTARKGFLVDLSPISNISLADDDSQSGWLGLGPRHDLSQVPTGETRLKGDLFKLAPDNTKPSAIRLASALDIDASYPEKAKVTINRKASSLLFLHTCTWTDKAGRRVGAYKVNYADGSSVDIPLIYGVNTASWLDQRSLNGATRVWEGRTRDGQKAMLQKMQWDNPDPQKEISSVEFISDKTEAGPVLIAVSGLE